ncbi:TPA: hypothetical protein ACNVV3_000935 [Pseudomonas putida]
MSLESQVADLIVVNNKLADYYNTKKAAIDAAVSAAVAAAPAISRAFYVDSQIGSDENVGSRASPFKTLQRAVDATPSGGRCDVTLLRDYGLDRHVMQKGRSMLVRSDLESPCKLVLNEFTTEDGLVRMGSFWQASDSALEFANLTLVLPASSAVVDRYCALTFSSGSTAPLMLSLRFFNCGLELRGTFRGYLIGPESSVIGLGVTNTTIPAALAGRIVPSVAAGTESKSLSNIITNVPTL